MAVDESPVTRARRAALERRHANLEEELRMIRFRLRLLDQDKEEDDDG